MYEAPLVFRQNGEEVVENETHVVVAGIGLVLLYFGSAWAFCQGTCGWMKVRSCEAHAPWSKKGWVKAVCK